MRERVDWRGIRWTLLAAVGGLAWFAAIAWAFEHLTWYGFVAFLMAPFWLVGGGVWVLVVVLNRRDRKRLLEEEFRE